VRRFVFASSGGTVYGTQDVFPCDEDHPKRPASPYGVAKHAFELYLESFRQTGDLEPVVLRYANVYGPRQWPKGEAGIVAILAEALLAGETPRIFGDGEQTRDYVHVDDVVAANRAAYATDRLGAYNIGTGVETSVNELYRLVARELGSTIEPRHVAAVEGELRRNALDASRIERELGVAIGTGLAEGLAKTLAWYRARAVA
jgi:UDP-glucose 4-epimerase